MLPLRKLLTSAKEKTLLGTKLHIWNNTFWFNTKNQGILFSDFKKS